MHAPENYLPDAVIPTKLPLDAEQFAANEGMRLLEPYYRWTFHLVEEYLGRRILDAGCGIGGFTQLLAERAEYVAAADLSGRNIEVVRRRFRDAGNVEVFQADLEGDLSEIKKRGLDTIVCLDVLEHVEDDVAVLRKFREIVEPPGALLLKVPACPWLYGSIDVASSHYRRYDPFQLREKAATAGWTCDCVFYMNIFGVLPYWLKGRVLKRKTTLCGSFPSWQIRLLRSVMPVLERVDGFVGPPIGQSAILVAR